LIAKLNQLAELRNGIRNRRTVDEITRNEGEAAILWFKQVLKLQKVCPKCKYHRTEYR
jgi:hypothetical protein